MAPGPHPASNRRDSTSGWVPLAQVSPGIAHTMSAKPGGKWLQDQICSALSILDEKSYKEVTYYYVALQRSTLVFVLS